MTRLVVPGRALLLVAGMPGAGKSTLLRSLPPGPGLRVLDSDAYRARLGTVLAALPYAWYRPLVHLWHRLAALVAAVSTTPVVVVHLPATDHRTRAVVAAVAALTGRSAHLLWLHVEAEEALAGQRERGRVVPGSSFAGHAVRAATATARLREGGSLPGWSTVTVLDRARACRGLRLDTTPATTPATTPDPTPPTGGSAVGSGRGGGSTGGSGSAPVERAHPRPQ